MNQYRVLFDLIKRHEWNKFISIIKENEEIDVNIKDETGNYLIQYCVLFNQKEALSLLISRNARVDVTDNDNRSIIYYAIKYGYQDILKLLLHFNNISIGIPLVDIQDDNERIPLHYAIQFKNIEATKVLLSSGSNVNLKDKDSHNSLHLAIYSKNLEIVNLIIDKHPAINSQINTGETSLHIACNLELQSIVQKLLEVGADPNIKDNEHELTPLNYAVNLNNTEIVKLLIKYKANINSQDFYGRTVYHYVVQEGNYDIFFILTMAHSLIEKPNFDIFDADGKTVAHLILETSSTIQKDFLQIILPKANLNIQDNHGQTPMFLICKNGLWKQKYVQDIIKTKKVNIFLKNIRGKRPIDLIDKNDLQKFIDLITLSYLHTIRNGNEIWKEDWENACKKELFENDLSKEEFNIINKYIKINKNTKDDVCNKIINKKIIDIYQGNTKSDCVFESSYPRKKNSTCVKLNEGNSIDFCTFTGMTIDVLFGMIYLLNKHKNAISTITSDFIKNEDLCKYYASQGININTECEFLNFELIWTHRKLFVPVNFEDIIEQIIVNSKARFIIIPLGIELREGNHANYLIIDKEINEIERFEPNGSEPPYQFNYSPSLLDNVIKTRFQNLIPNIKYFSPSDYLPKIGFQFFDAFEQFEKKIGDPGGFCALWCVWYADQRISNPTIPRKELVIKIIKSAKQQNISFKNMIRNYSKFITDTRNDILKTAKLDINDWQNNNFTTQQYQIIIKNIQSIIEPLITR